ncbi:sulfite exporter TauE/SafE family protein [Acidipropionibacterium virtanenii]|uniref:Probable membrane transporter protein n=1 Tax=Acidipropionibacterium virtanenii TaxID=2057246 RepID=A0A344UQY9_9ACTN|nr:sulfite exporter TauE/SafE family protein [Acidipropionibacterium virtanenii]AXE37687.1 hypothetical protein JS278_00494 [Acidipropionibacterium virtanenii]
MSVTATWILTGAVLFIASMVQRVTGMGLALLASPFLVLILGSTTGIQTCQFVGLGVCLASAVALRRDINLRRTGLLLVASAIGLLPGVWISRTLSSAWLSIVIGSVTICALASIQFLRRSSVFEGRKGVALAGGLSGFMNVTAGVGGPPLVVYANSTGWRYTEYVATVQLFFTGLNVMSLAGRGLPQVPGSAWAVIIATAAGGTLLGNFAGPRINDNLARRLVLAIALVGSLATVIRGITSL